MAGTPDERTDRDARHLAVEDTAHGGDAAVSDTISRDGPPIARSAPRSGLQSGQAIRQYELIRELGRGGMGQVFLARDVKLGRRVAMKFLTGGSAEFTQRLLLEARATARCSHENIVVLYEADEHDGHTYMVLEYLEGVTLRKEMAGRRLPANRVVELMVPVIRALTRAHEFGIVHRDLKPENVFVTSTGTIKVLDFGVAKLFTPEAGQPEATPGEVPVDAYQNAMVGTLPYMAPEQLLITEVDHRSDLWAVGVMLFEMALGRHPLHPFTPHSLVRDVARLDLPMPRAGDAASDLPESLERIINRCLAKRKEDRFASARELLDELEPLSPRRFGRRLAEDESPYPGLSAFQEADADRFFGRERDVTQLVTLLRNQPLVAVAGPSGVGKSSFVRAGVVPALKASGEAWEVFILRPGRGPLDSLATLLQPLASSSAASVDNRIAEHAAIVARLAEEPGYLGALLRSRAAQKQVRILLFVDQFEELFTLVPDAGERGVFLACLSGVADDTAAPVRIIVSMRSDFLDRVTEDRRFMDSLMHGLVFLQPLKREELQEALVQPVEMHGYRFESPEMVTAMLDALASSAGALPLLQFAAAKLWEVRDRPRKVLTQASYTAMGGMSGALATHADQALARLAPAAQRLARTLLPRLVTVDGTRAVVDIAELAELAGDPAEARALVDQLIASRLVVAQARGESEGAAVELVHESLIAGWPTLRRWLDEGREDAAFLAQLRDAARQWGAKGRSPGLLWRGEAMQEARLWRLRYKGELATREREYLDAVFALAGRATRIRRAVVGASIVLLVSLVVIGSFALLSIRRAERSAVAEATRAQREAERARGAEQKVTEQLAAVRAAEEARARARAEVAQGKEDLHEANGRLQIALGQAKDESLHAQEQSKRAQAEAARAQQLTQSVREANTKLEKLLAEERARTERLERETKKITTKLK